MQGAKNKPATLFWRDTRVEFGLSNCRGWFPSTVDWCSPGMPQCIYVALMPSTEDRMAAMRLSGGELGHIPMGLTSEEEEERLMRIAIAESAAESKLAYERKYGTAEEQEARRKKAAEEHEKEEMEELEVLAAMKASSSHSSQEQEYDRDVRAAIEASK
ncbi:unnamed protein product [Discosporangium mesarthrocarpum]